MSKRREKYLWGALVILLFTGLAKIMTSFFANEALLNQAHALFPATNRSVFFWVGTLECLGVGYLILERSWIHRFLFLTTLGILFGVYRGGMFWMGETSCGCLGSLGDWMKAPSAVVNSLLYAALAYLTLGGGWFLIKEKQYLDAQVEAADPIQQED